MSRNVTSVDGADPGNKKRIYDVLIIGGGPAGLTASLFCKTHNLDVIVIEAKKLGGQLSQIYPTKFILNYSSYPEIRAGYLGDLMVHHARYKEVELVEKETVQRVEREDRIFKVTTRSSNPSSDGEKQYQARSMIITIGMGLFEPTKLNIPGESELEGKGVYYAVPNIEVFRGKSVLVVGGGDTAVEDAVGLAGISKVTLVHRRSAFRATETNLDLLSMSQVSVLTPYTLKAIEGDAVVERAVIRNENTMEMDDLQVDAVIVNVGFAPDLSLLEKLDIDFERNSITIQDNDMHTNVEGVFACGDVVTYPGKVKQIHPALGEAAIAAEEAYKYVKTLRSDH